MTATIANLSAFRQARGLPPARPVPSCPFRKGQRIRVVSRGRQVAYIRGEPMLNATGTDWILCVYLDGAVQSVEARECEGDNGPEAA